MRLPCALPLNIHITMLMLHVEQELLQDLESFMVEAGSGKTSAALQTLLEFRDSNLPISDRLYTSVGACPVV